MIASAGRWGGGKVEGGGPFTFVGGAAEAGHPRQQRRQAVLRPAVWKHASVVTQTRIWVVWNAELGSVRTCWFTVLTFFIRRTERPVV